MSWSAISQALREKLNTLSNSPPIAWENMAYNPTLGTEYLRPTLLPIKSTLLTVDKLQQNGGLFSVSVYTRADAGEKRLLQLIDAIASLFSSVDFLTAGATSVEILGISRSTIRLDGQWATATVDIEFKNYE